MNNNFDRDWEKRLRPFERVWERVQNDRRGSPFPPPPPPPMFGPPPPPPFPPRGCCTKAVRFNPHGRRG